MTTIVNNPPSNDSGGLMGVVVLIVVLVVLGYLGYVYGLPALQQMQSGGVQINVPKNIDVNVKQTE